ncbi:MAG: PD-(D/E)XK nuclease family protein, partial [Deltaproteobacteria bacterium]|nr:PD-(D/E)XK nuclease family protein [Deltaproteobacteria bacterium]
FDECFEPRPAGREDETGGIAFGLAFHEVMERLDLVSGKNLRELCRIKAMEQFIPGMAEKIAGLCQRCLEHPLMERARRSRRIFREVPFSMFLDERIVEGKIDLLFEEEDRWVIVDYKTDDVFGEALEQRFLSYRQQGTWYAQAVQKVAEGKVKEVVFFFVRPGKVRFLKKEGRSIAT